MEYPILSNSYMIGAASGIENYSLLIRRNSLFILYHLFNFQNRCFLSNSIKS
jgi:hypothetical protein